eukprot:COSAG04_NODE_23717_length_333_cov_1.324786_1_plen_36_part_10
MGTKTFKQLKEARTKVEDELRKARREQGESAVAQAF